MMIGQIRYIHGDRCEDCGNVRRLYAASGVPNSLSCGDCMAFRINGYIETSSGELREMYTDLAERAKDLRSAARNNQFDVIGVTEEEWFNGLCVGCNTIIRHGQPTVDVIQADYIDRQWQLKPRKVHADRRCHTTCSGHFDGSEFIHETSHETGGGEHDLTRTTYGNLCSYHYNESNLEDLSCCDRCSIYTDYDDIVGHAGENLCDSCYQDYGHTCDTCDREYVGDYDDHECQGAIHDYSYRPSPEFFGYDTHELYMGFELEVESRGNWSCAKGSIYLEDMLGTHAYFKYDGSLSNGFEIVTHPHTLDKYKSMDWSWTKTLRDNGFRSWDTRSCGFHIHVSKATFGHGARSEHAIQAHQLRFLKLIYDNEPNIIRLAGRESQDFASFADFGSLVPKVKHGMQHRDRYSAVNVGNDETYEIRVFKGSLNERRVLAYLEFVHSAVEYTRVLRSDAVYQGALAWRPYMNWVVQNDSQYENLASLLTNMRGSTGQGE